MLILLLAATGTALATGLGAIPVFLLGERATALQPLLLGIAAGTMGVASVVGLILPGLDEGSASSVATGVGTGVLFLIAVRGALEARQRHVERAMSAGSRPRSWSSSSSSSTACPRGSQSARPTRRTRPVLACS